MLYVALVVSLIQLLVSNKFVWNGHHPLLKVIGMATVFSFGPIVLGMFLPPVVLQAILLIAVVLVLLAARQGEPRIFLAFSCGVTLISFGVFAFFAFQDISQLQQEFAYVSMENRLPTPRIQLPTDALPPKAQDRLNAMESLIENEAQRRMYSYRTPALRQIHEDTVQVFVTRPGFGLARMTGIRESFLRTGPRQEPTIPQPGIPSPSPWLPELWQKPSDLKVKDGLLYLHEGNVVDFVNVAGFGYIKDRLHVAGFQEHQVSQKPALPESSTLQRLDLIGLVVHDTPVAYVSEYLPRMEELRAAPTRNLDEFEAAGLPALQRGEDLFVRERGEECRVLGSIRAARQCVSCHGGERGDLLGAFSYRLIQNQK